MTTKDTPRITPVHAPSPPEAFEVLAQANGHDEGAVTMLPDGRTVLLEKPRGYTGTRINAITAQLVSSQNPDGRSLDAGAQSLAVVLMRADVEAVMHVKAIGDKRAQPVLSAKVFEEIADNLGDAGLFAVQEAIRTHWPPVTQESREAIKKNSDRPDLS